MKQRLAYLILFLMEQLAPRQPVMCTRPANIQYYRCREKKGRRAA